jgi:transposase-like protein
MEVLTLSGVEGGLAGSIQLLLNEAMKVERGAYLQAEPYERSEFRQDQSNGFKPKTLTTRMGELNLLVPQTRNGGFYPSIIEKGLRSERALFATIAEMYVQGVSTRRVTSILEELCGCEISSSQVSRICKRLDEELNIWRNRRLGSFAYLIADARYEKVRFAGSVRDLAILWAIGVTHDGRREILGISVSLSEAEVHWRNFFKGLLERGLHGLTYIVSDDHIGLKTARTTVFPGVAWNRCHTHLAHNAQGYISKQERKGLIAQEVRDILQAPDLASAKQLLDRFLKTWQSKEPKLASWAETNIPEGFSVFELPRNLRRHFRTSNLIERMNQELKRRSRVVRIFPNEESCLRLLSAVLLEIHEDWSSSERRLFLTQDL